MQPTTDAYDENSDHAQVLSLPWISYGNKDSFSGKAQTVRCHNDNSMVRVALEEPGEGRILVVDGWESCTHALMGAEVSALAVENGWHGIIIAGAVRDTTTLANTNLGIFALGTVPRKSRKNGIGVIGETISIGGGRVRPGDQILADVDGVVALPA